MAELWRQLDAIELANAKLQVKKMRTIEKAIRSDSPSDILRAKKAIEGMQERDKDVGPKSYFIDPLQFNSNLGYKDKAFSLTYTTLKRMSKTPIINSIIKTRKNQVADFAELQENKYQTGFIVRKKPKGGVEQKMDNNDKRIAFAIADFLLKGGNSGGWGHDDFDTFIRKIVDDSLTYDQMTFEVMRNRRGKVESFIATDASTFRIANSFFAEDYDSPYFRENKGIWGFSNEDFGEKVKGYYPSYVQIYQNNKIAEFYPWELCFGVRNPSTSIYANGYGCSELEELINVVTSLLWGDEYNRRFFSQGSAPKGMLRVKGTVNETSLQQFKQQWQSMITGVMQSWKTPVVNQDVEWIDLQKNNRDMEYSSWMEYLIKLACAVYNIDPVEIGWDISRGSNPGGLFEGSQEQRFQHSKDKGLYPLLKFLQRKINKYIVEPIHPDYELVFMGLNGMSIEQELEMDIKKVGAFATINEIREKYEMKPLEDGDIIENSIYAQARNAAQSMAMQQEGQVQESTVQNTFEAEAEESEEENPFDLYAEESDDEAEKAENSFVKAFDYFMEKELNK